MNRPSILDALTTMQATPNARAVPPEILIQSAEYWTTVATRHDRHGRYEQALRLRANAARMKRLAVEMTVLRSLCANEPGFNRRIGKIVAARVQSDPHAVAWLVDWFYRAPSFGSDLNGR